jgi:glyoxalase/bleomycin resistance protein/dioxygenase superfamily protein
MNLTDPGKDRAIAGCPMVHHYGFAVRRILDAAPVYCALFAARWNGTTIHDPLQAVRVAFLTPRTGGPLIELIESAGRDGPVPEGGPVYGAIHHVCLEVDKLEISMVEIQRTGAILVRRPAPAIAFENRLIAWLYTREHLLVELLERSQK